MRRKQTNETVSDIEYAILIGIALALTLFFMSLVSTVPPIADTAASDISITASGHK